MVYHLRYRLASLPFRDHFGLDNETILSMLNHTGIEIEVTEIARKFILLCLSSSVRNRMRIVGIEERLCVHISKMIDLR